MERRVGGDALIPVEHENARDLQAGVKVLEIPEGEGLDAWQIFRGEEGEGLPPPGGGSLCCEAQVIEKRRRIFVACVYLVPKTGETPRENITTHQGGLPASRRCGYVDNRTLPQRVQQIKQPGALEHPGRDRTGDLGKTGSLPESHSRPRVLPPGNCTKPISLPELFSSKMTSDFR
jgi:hypothetical protein